MLRRKLMLGPGLLVVAYVILAIIGIWKLQGILRQLDHISTDSTKVMGGVYALSTAITSTEAELYELQLGRTRHLNKLIEAIKQVEATIDELGEIYVTRGPEEEGADAYQRIKAIFPEFQKHVQSLATTLDPTQIYTDYQNAIGASLEIRRNLMELSQVTRGHVNEEQLSVTLDFRWVVLGLTISTLLAINLAVMVLLRMTGMVLKPVEALVEASRELGKEHFDHRVELHQRDEFDELGKAYNSLAEQLLANEERKIEILQQTARTLNHELNNALSIIQLQLQLLDRKSGGDETQEKHLRQIREGLGRMTKTVASLKYIRRIVLTDYSADEKMLDLERSLISDSVIRSELSANTNKIRKKSEDGCVKADVIGTAQAKAKEVISEDYESKHL